MNSDSPHAPSSASVPSDDKEYIVDGSHGTRVSGATLCECGDRADDHDDTDAYHRRDGILGQCFKCPCATFTLPTAAPSPARTAPSADAFYDPSKGCTCGVRLRDGMLHHHNCNLSKPMRSPAPSEPSSASSEQTDAVAIALYRLSHPNVDANTKRQAEDWLFAEFQRLASALSEVQEAHAETRANYATSLKTSNAEIELLLAERAVDRQDAERWRAVAPVLHPGSWTAHSDYYMISFEFRDEQIRTANEYADRLIARAANPETSNG